MSDLEAACRALVAGFVATEPPRRHRKSETLAGTVGGAPVIAKRAHATSPVWTWYAQREIALYRAFASQPLPVRTPALVAASDDLLVMERVAGAPIAAQRRPHAALDVAVLEALLATIDALEAARSPSIDVPAPARVRTQLRDRLLEDPTEDWIRDGLDRCARRGILEATVAQRARVRLEGVPRVLAHGDLLLRNAIEAPPGVRLVDWECAGLHLRDWDRALLWTQLDEEGRVRIEQSIDDHGPRSAAFRALLVFALAREVKFARAFADEVASAVGRARDELAGAVARLV